MKSGKLDLLFALAQTPLAPGVMSEVYARDRMVVVMRKGHPLARRRWTIEDFGRVEHAAISILGGEASETDALLARVGVKRDIRLVTPHFMGALATVSQTNMVTTIGRALASRFADELGLLFKESCLPNPDLDLTIVWSEACATDPVLAWVRTMIREVAAETIGACTDSRQTRVSRRAERL
jgi:DNA-binding transcriptional LysR family regulator